MDVFDALRDESYTGSNRCWPCTLVNIGAVGLLVALLRARGRSRTGLLAAVAGVAVVALRGYLVPYTPQFAPRLVAAAPLPDTWFHETGIQDEVAMENEAESLSEDVEPDGEAVLEELVAAGVVVAEGERLFLDEAFEAAWHDRMDDLAADSLRSLAATLQTELPQVETVDPFTDAGREWVALGSGTGRLLPRPKAVAELAAYETISAELGSVEPRRALAGAAALLMFLETCPVCETDLVESSTVSCCGGHSGPQQTPGETLVCPTCEQRLYTFEEL